MSNVTAEQWAIPQQKNPNTGDRRVCVCVCVRGGGGEVGRGTRLKTFRIFRDIKERTCANPRSQYHPRGVHEKLAKFPLIVLVSTLEFSPKRCVTQF